MSFYKLSPSYSDTINLVDYLTWRKMFLAKESLIRGNIALSEKYTKESVVLMRAYGDLTSTIPIDKNYLAIDYKNKVAYDSRTSE